MKRLALCLSGGGFRATLFHFGVLRRLHETGLLPYLHIVSAVSGGAITAALFQAHVKGIDRETGGLNYDWDKFQAKLLHTTSRGILHHFYFSWILWILLVLLLSLSGPHFLSWGWISSGLMAVFCYVYLFRAVLRANQKCFDESRHWEKFSKSFGQIKWTPYNSFILPLIPSEMRIATLVDEVYGSDPMGSLHRPPLTCLSATDLISGNQKVFSSRILAELSDYGATALWENRTDKTIAEQGYMNLWLGEPYFSACYNIEPVTIARVVAASTAIPPIFSHVSFLREEEKEYLGSFVDGGVLDNFGINPIVQFSYSISDRRQRYNEDSGGSQPFNKFISHILIADAGGRMARRFRYYFLRINLLRRVVGVMLDHQGAETQRKRWLLQSVTELPVSILGLQTGYPEGVGLDDSRWPAVLSRIRTHLDGFRNEESACIIYSGYTWVDYWIRSELREESAEVRTNQDRSAPANLKDMLSHSYGEVILNEEKLITLVARRGVIDSVKRFLYSISP